MKKLIHVLSFFLCVFNLYGQVSSTTFEKTNGMETTTYADCISFYQQLAKKYPKQIQVKTFGMSDAGYPLHLIVFSSSGSFQPISWKKENKLTILVNNGIHPGEPDGIDASMMLLRDAAEKKIRIPGNVVLAVIPIYNIGGALNRNSHSRVNQDGPLSYGFRGNAQNLDLNRDFTKSDSKNAKAFAEIFHYMDPDILIDNHVSDGADYQHTMTLLTTQHNKLGYEIGSFLHEVFEPAIYKSMEKKNWPLIPYVNFYSADPGKGWSAFMDPPRFSSGYAALFQTLAFVPETHMLKPFKERVKSTYDLMRTMIDEGSRYAKEIKAKRKASIEAMISQQAYPLSWRIDSSRSDKITFMGYESGKKQSEVTGMDRLYYDRTKPYSAEIDFYNYFTGEKIVNKPKAYVIPQGWYEVIDLLKLNKVSMERLKKDTVIAVESYRVEDYQTRQRPYEKHYPHYNTKVSSGKQNIRFLKGDYIIYTGQRADRFLVEMLEPAGDDSYFAWNFFDAILQQKEGYSEYRWEDVAAQYLRDHPEVRKELEERKKTDKGLASASAQLEFVYKRSPYYEPAHLRYPVYRIN